MAQFSTFFISRKISWHSHIAALAQLFIHVFFCTSECFFDVNISHQLVVDIRAKVALKVHLGQRLDPKGHGANVYGIGGTPGWNSSYFIR